MAHRSRVAGFLIALALALGGSVALAAPASADSYDCYQYLRLHYWGIHEAHEDACLDGEHGFFADCVDELRDHGIHRRFAIRACERADW
ncbi:hypothetical protein N8J89_11840 [Crossiella sp. CA-258035]|uniref:hypothetical protein n=1 Tax=Crossiella sp. CA-258035 TaxID=2981138 RepID=UPI0024BC949A|nr:hypothetical protein [Crossiella sp. CA-258035]WHT21719.1 hypothetical protein N8J89_11840 [Crossiella sp. CA-258035]